MPMAICTSRCFRFVSLCGFALLLVQVPPASALTFQNPVAGAPLAFEANHGQSSAEVDFLARGDAFTAFLTPDALTLRLQEDANRHVIRMDVLGSRQTEAVGRAPLVGRSHYLKGVDRSAWIRDIPRYGTVEYAEIYPGIDLRYHANQRQLEYDFILAPGANAEEIRLRFVGVEDCRLAATGDLLLRLSAGQEPLRFRAPVAYQEFAGRRVIIASAYRLLTHDSVGFQLGPYDRDHPVVIDPILDYGSYLGGTGNDTANGIALGSGGEIYVTGYTSATDFPATTGAYDEDHNGDNDVFVAKLNAAGSALVYATYIGGLLGDGANGIAVDGSGQAFLAGYTYSDDFPTTTGAFQTSLDGNSDAFVLKLNAAGSDLVYSTYLGGREDADAAYDIDIDAAGNAYIAGGTDSDDFPTSAGALDENLGGTYDGFVVKMNPSGSGIVYGTYLGGDLGNESTRGIAVDGAGNAYLTGHTGADDFPVTVGAYDESNNGGNDAYFAKLNAAGTGLSYATYLGGVNHEYGRAVCTDATGHAYVTGYTASGDFPTSLGAFQTAKGLGDDIFVTKIDPAETGAASLVYSSFLGGGGYDRGYAIAVDSGGRAHVVGYTASTNMPKTGDAHDTVLSGSSDAVLSILDATGGSLDYGTYLGGDQAETGYGIIIDGTDNIYLTGYTDSGDFATTAGALAETHNGAIDAFIVRFLPTTSNFEISGTVFEDVDFAGAAAEWDGGAVDVGLPGADVELYGAADAYLGSTSTDGVGSFGFAGLADGSYKLRVRSASLGDPDSPPAGGYNAGVPGSWPYPLPEMVWGQGVAMVGGQDPALDDTATADNSGPGDTYVVVVVSGADVSGVNVGFSYELIVNTADDGRADTLRSVQGTLRQFIKNSNAIAGTNRSWFQIP